MSLSIARARCADQRLGWNCSNAYVLCGIWNLCHARRKSQQCVSAYVWRVVGHVGGEIFSKDSTEAASLALFIGRATEAVDECAGYFDPTQIQIDCETAESGRRVLRRLCHVEYDNTISDLFGLDSNWGHRSHPIMLFMDTTTV